MKYLIASDIHGSAYWAERLCAAIESEQPDRIVLLGDLLYHGPRNDLPRDYAPKRVIPLLNALADRIIAVRGNCDAEVDQMVLDFPVMADYATLFDETGREPRLWRRHAQQRRPRARVARGLSARLRPHAHQGQRGKRRAPGPVALQPR